MVDVRKANFRPRAPYSAMTARTLSRSCGRQPLPQNAEQIYQLYHAVKQGSAEERATVLSQTDPDLRREVESLLARQSGDMFPTAPPSRPVRSSFRSSSLLSAGTCLGPYRIEHKLGK